MQFDTLDLGQHAPKVELADFVLDDVGLLIAFLAHDMTRKDKPFKFKYCTVVCTVRPCVTEMHSASSEPST